MNTIESEMKIGALAPWFGSKRTLAPVIVQELGKHRAYWEPMCASMAVLFGKPESRIETVNDLHGDVINLARVVSCPTLGPKLYRQLRRLPCSDDILASCDAVTRDGDYATDQVSIDRARAFFVASWQGRNGEVGLAKSERGRTLAIRWTPNGGDPATRFESAVLSIPAWRRRLRNVTILRRDAFTVLEKIGDDAGTCIYCDPPYLIKSDRYLHDFNDGFMQQANDHERLAVALARFKKARVVVSYYAHPALVVMYPKWTVRPVHQAKNLAAMWKRDEGNATVAPEVLLINGPSLAKEVP